LPRNVGINYAMGQSEHGDRYCESNDLVLTVSHANLSAPN